jgi:amidase
VTDELAFLPALEQARLVREGAVSSVELVETYLRRIERLDPTLNAYVTVCSE